jgi:hypothetical protein
MKKIKDTKVPRKVQWWLDPVACKQRDKIQLFMDKYEERKGIYFNYFKLVRIVDGKFTFIEGDVESEIRGYAKTMVQLLQKEFPDWEVTPNVQSEDYRPPYDLSWEFSPKALL